MTEIILDTNVMGAFLFSETNTPAAQKVMQEVRDGQMSALVPSLFWAELQHVCFRKTIYDRRANPTPVSLAVAEARYATALTYDLPEFGDELTTYRVQAWDLVRTLGLGSYDACFLALALHLGIPVWTFDAKFRDPVAASSLAASVCLIGVDVTI